MQLVAFVGALALALWAPLAAAQAKNSLESMTFSSIQGGKIIVKAAFKEPLKGVPQGFAVTNPPRIAIDLPDTLNGMGKTQVDAGEGEVAEAPVVVIACEPSIVTTSMLPSSACV